MAYLQHIIHKMGQQHRKETKRRRRGAYLKRKKEMIKLAKTSSSIPLARKVSEPAAAEVSA